MRLFLILLLAAWIGVSVGCNKSESYKSREADTSADDAGSLIADDPSLSGAEPAAEGDAAEPAEGDAAAPAEGDEAKPEEPAEEE